MTIRSIQKVIKIGSSTGVTLPAKELKHAGLKPGDEVDVTIRKTKPHRDADDKEVLAAAEKILADYKQDFKNLANR